MQSEAPGLVSCRLFRCFSIGLTIFLFPACQKGANDRGMSDENTPKMRLRPKLGSEPSAVTPAQPKGEAPAEAKAVVPRSKLSLKQEAPVQTDSLSTPAPPVPLRQQAVMPNLDARTFPAPPPKQVSIPMPARAKPQTNPPHGVNTSAAAESTPSIPPDTDQEKLPGVLKAPPPPGLRAESSAQEAWPAVLDAPPPPGLAPDGDNAEPAEITAIRKASTFPFPSPTAKFPPLPGFTASAAEEESAAGGSEGFLKKLLLIGTLVILVLGAGGAFAYFKFFAKSGNKAQPASAPATAVETPMADTATGGSKAQQMIDQVKQQQLAPLNEVIAGESQPAPAGTGAAPGFEPALATAVAPTPTTEPVVAAQPPPVPVKPPPPAPSLAFKTWVAKLKIRGVRGGDSPRVFIDRTSYAPGDVVNLQLGIIFVNYDDDTRMLVFQEPNGATFERRH